MEEEENAYVCLDTQMVIENLNVGDILVN